MRTKRLKVFDQDPSGQVNNRYPTTKDAFVEPSLHLVVGTRTAGKSYLCAKLCNQYAKDKTFDVIYMITPSFSSNREYFGKHVQEANTFYPTKESIQQVIQRVEADRDEFEQYLQNVKRYKTFTKEMSTRHPLMMSNETLLHAYQHDFFSKPPTWKYEKVEPPKSLVILDDCLNSPALLQSSGLVKLATLNRHLAPLQEKHSDRSACGLAVIILSQTYRAQNAVGRVLRENLSLFTCFANKQQKQMDAIEEELANVVDVNLYRRAFEYATREKYGSLTLDFVPKCPTKTFRKNLNEAILFDELPCECPSKK